MAPRLPTFLIVGAAKSGTSSLWNYLREHPEVYVPPQKEPNFFSDDGIYSQGPEWYAGLFAAAGNAKAVGEASPSYLWSSDAAGRISSLIPHARLIAILRNPIDRAYSHYLHAVAYTMETRSFRQVVEAESRRPVWPFYLGHSRYQHQLQRFADHFSRDQLLVLLLDDLVARPVETFQMVCRHVAIDPSFIPPNVGDVTNAYRESRAAPLLRFWMRPGVRNRIPRPIWRSIGRMLLREGGEPEPIEPDLRRQLAEHFAEENASLGRWLGRDLSEWR